MGNLSSLHIIILRFLCLFKRKKAENRISKKKRTKTKARILAKTKRAKLKVVCKI